MSGATRRFALFARTNIASWHPPSTTTKTSPTSSIWCASRCVFWFLAHSKQLRKSQKDNSDKERRIAELERTLADRTNRGPALRERPEDGGGDAEEDDDPGPAAARKRTRPQRSLSSDSQIVEPPSKRQQTAPPDGADLGADTDGPPSQAQAATWGARYVTKCCPWLVHDDVISLPLDAKYDPTKRFMKYKGKFIEANIMQGQVRDLLDLMPPQYHRFRFKKDFIDAVCSSTSCFH